MVVRKLVLTGTMVCFSLLCRTMIKSNLLELFYMFILYRARLSDFIMCVCACVRACGRGRACVHLLMHACVAVIPCRPRHSYTSKGTAVNYNRLGILAKWFCFETGCFVLIMHDRTYKTEHTTNVLVTKDTFFMCTTCNKYAATIADDKIPSITIPQHRHL